MAVDKTPPRTPRPGDPFGQPGLTGAAPARTKVQKKKGRRFFIGLLVVGTLMTIASLLFTSGGRQVTVWEFEQVVIPRSIPEALPLDYPDEQARTLIRALKAYFKLAGTDAVTDDQLALMMNRISIGLSDHVLSIEELDMLLESTRTLRTQPVAP